MRSVELFTGCGGLALGLSRAGFHHELMVEWNGDAVETVLHNRRRRIKHVSEWPLEKADVREITWRRFGGLDLVAGGPPCQPFSIGGKHKGQGDNRDMWPEVIRAVREIRPRGFLFENVRGLARPAFANYLRWIIAHLHHPEITRLDGEDHARHTRRLEASRLASAYRVIVVQVNAADYGAAQKRHRVIVAGIRSDLACGLATPTPTHSRERLLWDQWVSGEYWKRHGLRQPADAFIPPTDAAAVRALRALRVAPKGKPWVTTRDALMGLGEPNGKSNHVFQDGARVYPGHTGSPLDQPAKALKAGDHGVPGGENMMVRDDGSVRYFTTREAARLQGLPDTYQFPRSWTESMRQLGNAVPSQLAEAMGTWMAETLATAPASDIEAA
ncbi:DNA cytosine methyltransferase [Xanthomonas campestris pv. merremiae]|uniref:DNA cytosine methyltransferase n=1 Tax=Xanthomonas citri TaxID=346 RepID=UPI000B5CA336|nr:DNA (cytosine-5-)-methyltransferase [Xanthomonas citri]ASK98988.1 DNA (cytosine-5-)-methyltransferase [Xanthomonas citri pv. vignicola]MBV6839654.1 DNA cytosine methyltransferase [Xanthomonas campestris pv. merremiae]MBZ3934540.1 cytosine methyltransferase [Xanthomonas campestris pv. merremiae]MCC8567316.1 DNA cytosine methyltransferase [Xanthomonas citri pv. fuscans]